MRPGFFQFLLALFLVVAAVFFMPLAAMNGCAGDASSPSSFTKSLPEAGDSCVGKAGFSRLLHWWIGEFDGRPDDGAEYDQAPAEIRRHGFRSAWMRVI